MRASARIQAIIELLDIRSEAKLPMDKVVTDYLRNRKYIGSKDRNFITGTIYDLIRSIGKLNWWINQIGGEVTPRTTAMAFLAKIEGVEKNDIEALFDGDKYSPEVLNNDEIKFLGKITSKNDKEDMPEAVRLECPAEFEEDLRNLWGDNFENELTAMLQQATLDLRINISILTRDKAKEVLLRDEAVAEDTPYSPWGLRAKEKIFLSNTRAFTKGYVEVQDEGSQLISFVCNAQPGMHVLDYCAGAGGKTLAIAMAMQNKARIVAMDINEGRLHKAKTRFKKAKVSDIIEIRALSDEKNRKWLKRQKQSFDVTLVDVPCSGTGTWRRNPDMRWINLGPSIKELIKIQSEILDKVAHTVKEGGRLVYATCSILQQENEDQIEAFLARNPEFELLPISKAWPEGYKCPNDGDYMRLTPYQHNTDGFFAAVLVRKLTEV